MYGSFKKTFICRFCKKKYSVIFGNYYFQCDICYLKRKLTIKN